MSDTSTTKESSEASRIEEEQVLSEANEIDEGEQVDEENEENEEEEEEEEEEEGTIEEKLEKEKDKVAQLKETITGLIAQFVNYKKAVADEKEKDKQKIEELDESTDLLEEQIEQLEARNRELEAQADEARKRSLSQLSIFRTEFDKLQTELQAANKGLADERAAHDLTIRQLATAREKTNNAWALENQEVRIKLSFDSGHIASVTMVPDTDEARAELKTQNDFLLSRMLDAQQRSASIADELERERAAKARLVESTAVETTSMKEQLEKAKKEAIEAQEQAKALAIERSVRLRKIAAPIVERYFNYSNHNAEMNVELPIEIAAKVCERVADKDPTSASIDPQLFDSARDFIANLLEPEVTKWRGDEQHHVKVLEMIASERMRTDFLHFISPNALMANRVAFLIEVHDFTKGKARHHRTKRASVNNISATTPTPTPITSTANNSDASASNPTPIAMTVTATLNSSQQKQSDRTLSRTTSNRPRIARTSGGLFSSFIQPSKPETATLPPPSTTAATLPPMQDDTLSMIMEISGQAAGPGLMIAESFNRGQRKHSQTLQAHQSSQNLTANQAGRTTMRMRQSCVMTGKRLETSFRLPGSICSVISVRKEIWIAAVAMTDTGKAGTGAIIHVYDRSLAKQSEFRIDSQPSAMLFEEKNVWISSEDATISIIDPKEHKLVSKLAGHLAGPVLDMARVGKQIWSVAADQCVCVWDLHNFALKKRIETGSFCQCVSKCGDLVWIGTSSGILFYDPRTFKQVKREKNVPITPRSAAETTAGAAAMPLTPTALSLTAVNKLLDIGGNGGGEVWAVQSDDKIVVWSASTLTQICTLDAKRTTGLMKLGPQVWVTSADGIIHQWDTVTRSLIRDMRGLHDDAIQCLTTVKGPENLRVISGSVDHVVCIWSTDYKPHELVECKPQVASTKHVAIGSGGSLAAIAVSTSTFCAVCGKSLAGVLSMSSCCGCRVCGAYAVHQACIDSVPITAICSPRNPATTSSSASASVGIPGQTM